MCPLKKEMEVHTILEYIFYPLLKAEEMTVPPSCPFHASNDRYAHARLRRAVNRGSFRCSFCNADFPAVEDLDRHMRTHANKISSAHDKCYSDFCDILGCESTQLEWQKHPPSQRDREHLLHKCRDVFGFCFDRRTKEGRDMHTHFAKKLCARFTEHDQGADSVHHSEDSSLVLRYLGFAFLAVLLLVFFILMTLYKTEAHSSTGSLQSQGLAARLRRTFHSPKKVKGY